MVESFTQPLMIACSGILYASSVSRLSASTRVGRYTCGVTGMKLTLLRLLAVICFVVVIMTTSRIAAQHTTVRLTPDEATKLGIEAYIYGYRLLTIERPRRVLSFVEHPEGHHAPMKQFANMRK